MCRSCLRVEAAELAAGMLFVLLVVIRSLAQANVTVLHTFPGGADGAGPVGVTIDDAGNLYGIRVPEVWPDERTLAAAWCGSSRGKRKGNRSMSRIYPRWKLAKLASGMMFALLVMLSPVAQAQTFSVIHNFFGEDGDQPQSGLTMDRGGNLYGTAVYGGDGNGGTVFKLTHQGTGWVLSILYSFDMNLGSNGIYPQAGVVIGPNGSLYGTAGGGGLYEGGCDPAGCGLVYNLRPPARIMGSILSPWTETVLYRFTGAPDGASPGAPVTFDQAGNLYGGTAKGGPSGHGVVYELQPANGGWSEQVLYQFTGGNDGGWIAGGWTFDHAGNLYGVANSGGAYGDGTAFRLSPSVPFWTESTLYAFSIPTGANPVGGLIFDALGNLYGGAPYGGANYGGTVFELIPQPNGNWNYALVNAFVAEGTTTPGPLCKLTMDSAGNLYGTTNGDGAFGYGSVFKLTPSDGGWIYSDLHDFTGGSDGRYPGGSSVTFDHAGNLYGTATGGGAYGYGVAWEITP